MATIHFDPPSFKVGDPSLNARVKDFLQYWDNFFIQLRNFLNRQDTVPFASVASATTINPVRQVQPITGSVTITTINATPDLSPMTLLAINGFSTGTSGNIAAVVTLAAGTAKDFYWNPVNLKWYPA